MKNNRNYVLCISIVLLIFISGCTQVLPKEEKTETITLYYADSENNDFVLEERQISFTDQEEKYKVTLEELIKGPDNKDNRVNISETTKIYGTISQDDGLLVNFSQEFNQFGGSMAEVMAVGSVVNTMTQFEEVNRVKILVDGEELTGPSGQPRGFMQSFEKEVKGTEEQAIKLYFSNEDADAVRGETRIIDISKTASREEILQMVLEELIEGPENSNLNRTIPPEVKVKSIKINNQTAIVDFSEEMHTKHWGGAAGESMTINSLVNTLTEFDYIELVKLTVEGQPLAIEHAIML